MDKGRHNEAAACEVERNNGSFPKAFESGCFITEGVCTFGTRYKCREASKASFRTQARSGPVVLSTLFHKSYLG